MLKIAGRLRQWCGIDLSKKMVMVGNALEADLPHLTVRQEDMVDAHETF